MEGRKRERKGKGKGNDDDGIWIGLGFGRSGMGWGWEGPLHADRSRGDAESGSFLLETLEPLVLQLD
jgi:hypothetical protein